MIRQPAAPERHADRYQYTRPAIAPRHEETIPSDHDKAHSPSDIRYIRSADDHREYVPAGHVDGDADSDES